MSFDPERYTHESDRAALNALKVRKLNPVEMITEE